MGEPLNLGEEIRGYSASEPGICTIEATCVTGFELAAQNEVQTRFPSIATTVTRRRGRIVFDFPIQDVERLNHIRTVDNLYVLIGITPVFDFSGKTEENLDRLVQNIETLCWNKGLDVWNRIFRFNGNLYPRHVKEIEEEEEEGDKKVFKLDQDVIPSFRCTCYRSGDNHNFSSMDVAKSVGGAINEKFRWNVKMKDFDIEVVINVDINQVYTSIALNKISLFKRNIRHFGPTTLRATICSSLLNYADIEIGDVVIDPLCGGGSIPIEGALGYPNGFYLAGDIHEKAYLRTKDNIKAIIEEDKGGIYLPCDVLRWDVTRLPLRDESIDVFVTDLPFGKRSGSKLDNRVLYPKIMLSMARVVRPKTGRAVILTQDKTSMFKSIGKINSYWKVTKHTYANIGGLAALVFFMTRTDKSVSSL